MCPDRLVGVTAPLVALFTRHDELARAYASILISGGREAGLFSDLATGLTERFRTVITERGCTAEEDAAARAGALYFAFVGLLFTAAAGGTSDPEARTSRAKSRPSPSGSIRSSNTRSNPEGQAARASPKEPATTGSNPSRVRALENGPEIEGSSSTNSTRGFTPATVGPRRERNG
jgi:hypothetical protein